MTVPHLLLGNKRYSSWSLRGYLALKFAKIDFDETVIPLFTPEMADQMAKFAPNAPRRVPMLVIEGHTIWDTMSLMEFAAENSNNGSLWPEEKYARAHARSVAAEMHAGFFALRGHIPMNLSRNDPAAKQPDDVQVDIDRILEIWTDCRTKYSDGGPYIFGKLSMADAAYAPVVARLKSRSVNLPNVCADYAESVWNLKDFKQWRMDAEKETWTIEQ